MKRFSFIPILMMLIFMVSCNTFFAEKKETNEQPIGTKMLSKGIYDQTISEDAKQVLKDNDGVTDVKAVNSDNKLLVAVKVQHMKRFQLKKIEKKLNKQLRKQSPQHEVILSLDKKIYLEVKKLEKKLGVNQFNNKKIDKKMKHIIALSKEKT